MVGSSPILPLPADGNLVPLPPSQGTGQQNNEEVKDGNLPPAPVATHTRPIGIIRPPQQIRSLVEKIALFVSKNGPQFEMRVVADHPGVLNFLSESSPYHAYYQQQLAEFRAHNQTFGQQPPPTPTDATVPDSDPSSALDGNQDEIEQERMQMAIEDDIDWHDFEVVETIEFADGEDDELPPPMTLEEFIIRSEASKLTQEEFILSELSKLKQDKDKGEEEIQLEDSSMEARFQSFGGFVDKEDFERILKYGWGSQGLKVTPKLEKELVRVGKVRGDIQIEGKRLVKYDWADSIFGPVQNQNILNCRDCWARSICTVIDSSVRILYEEDPDGMKHIIKGCDPAIVKSDSSSVQDMMESLKHISSDRGRRNKFLAEIKKGNHSHQVLELIQLFKYWMPPTHPGLDRTCCYNYYPELAWSWVKRDGICFKSDYRFKKVSEATVERHYIANHERKPDSKLIHIDDWDGITFWNVNTKNVTLEEIRIKEIQMIIRIILQPISGTFYLDPAFFCLKDTNQPYRLGDIRIVGDYEETKGEELDKEKHQRQKEEAEKSRKDIFPHEMPITGFDLRRPSVTARNSWGPEFGTGGYCKVALNSCIPHQEGFYQLMSIQKTSWAGFKRIDKQCSKSLKQQVDVVCTDKGGCDEQIKNQKREQKEDEGSSVDAIGEISDLKNMCAFEARNLLRKYDHMHVFDQNFEKWLVDSLVRGYRFIRSDQGFPQLPCNHIPAFTLRDLEDEEYKDLASLAIKKYNEVGEEKWVFEELISYSTGGDPYGRGHILYFGARSTSNQNLDPFYAYVYKQRDEKEEVKDVYSLRKEDLIESSLEEVDYSILRKTRNRTYVRQESRIISFRNEKEHKIESSVKKKIVIPNNRGEKLVGILHEGGTSEIVILCHDFPSTKDDETITGLAKHLAKEGISSFRFDFAGNGESGGSSEYCHFLREVEDLNAVVQHFIKENRTVCAVLGHGKGGTVALQYGVMFRDVWAIINVSGRCNLRKEIEKFLGTYSGTGFIKPKGKSGAIYRVDERSMDESRSLCNMREACCYMDKNCRVLTVHGSYDKVVPVREAHEIFAAKRENHDLVIVERADHQFSSHQTQLGKIVGGFVKKILYKDTH